MEEIKNTLLSLGISENDISAIETAFKTAVDKKVMEELAVAQASLEAEMGAKADEYCQTQIDSAVTAKTAELEQLANQYCESKAITLAKKADEMLQERAKLLEEKSASFIEEYFEKGYQEKYGAELDNLKESYAKELQRIEDATIKSLDLYLEGTIAKRITPDMIKLKAVNETFEPIIVGIQNLFEEQYVPLDRSGNKKLANAKAQIAELEESLKSHVEANMQLQESNEKYAKMALIAEKTKDLSPSDSLTLNEFFKDKKYQETKNDIDDFKNMLLEKAEMAKTIQMRKSETKLLKEQRSARKMKFRMDESTDNFVKSKFRKLIDESDDSYSSMVNKLL
ncbi:MAG: hypothetical protein MJZ34_07010 [Paludibacteraceae bacterium]|nr:hypothetical protein [Paludibacteraceae bacterium]